MNILFPSSLIYSQHHHVLKLTTLAELKASCTLISSSILGKHFAWTLWFTAGRKAKGKAQTHTWTCFWQSEEIPQEDIDLKHSAIFLCINVNFIFLGFVVGLSQGLIFKLSLVFNFLILSPSNILPFKVYNRYLLYQEFFNQVPQYWSLLSLTHIGRHDVRLLTHWDLRGSTYFSGCGVGRSRKPGDGRAIYIKPLMQHPKLKYTV